MSTRLSVNINKIAWLRNARGGNLPDLLQVAQDCERFGADGITVHPRPDERHITYQDVHDLKPLVKTEFNVEGYPSKRFLKLIEEIRPEQCTLVPDSHDVITSDQGWDTKKNNSLLTDICMQLKDSGCRLSVFVEPDEGMIEGAREVGADRIELYTGPYAAGIEKGDSEAVVPYQRAAQFAISIGMGINAGHDLSLHNLENFIQKVPEVLEVSIGHALISDSLYLGLENTIQMYRECLRKT